MRRINYTPDNEKLYPKVITYSDYGKSVNQTIVGGNKEDIWNFQKEWRYIIHSSIKNLDVNKNSLFISILSVA